MPPLHVVVALAGAFLRQLGEPHHAREDVVEAVREAAGHLPQHLQLARALQALLQFLLLRRELALPLHRLEPQRQCLRVGLGALARAALLLDAGGERERQQDHVERGAHLHAVPHQQVVADHAGLQQCVQHRTHHQHQQADRVQALRRAAAAPVQHGGHQVRQHRHGAHAEQDVVAQLAVVDHRQQRAEETREADHRHHAVQQRTWLQAQEVAHEELQEADGELRGHDHREAEPAAVRRVHELVGGAVQAHHQREDRQHVAHVQAVVAVAQAEREADVVQRHHQQRAVVGTAQQPLQHLLVRVGVHVAHARHHAQCTSGACAHQHVDGAPGGGDAQGIVGIGVDGPRGEGRARAGVHALERWLAGAPCAACGGSAVHVELQFLEQRVVDGDHAVDGARRQAQAQPQRPPVDAHARAVAGAPCTFRCRRGVMQHQWACDHEALHHHGQVVASSGSRPRQREENARHDEGVREPGLHAGGRHLSRRSRPAAARRREPRWHRRPPAPPCPSPPSRASPSAPATVR